MKFLDIILISISLSTDAFVLTITNHMIYPCLSKNKLIAMPIFFGFFQGLMSFLGSMIGISISCFPMQYSKYLVFLVFSILSIKMLFEAFCSKTEVKSLSQKNFTYTTLFLQAISTSIDAFAVGIILSKQSLPIHSVIMSISFITVILCTCAVYLGKRLGNIFKDKSSLLGGILLIFIAIKSLF